jgi:biotin transporter BioY
MKLRIAFVILICASLLATGLVAFAAPQAGYIIDWWTTGGGGGQSSGGGYSLSGTIGQPDAGSLSAAAYSLAGGYWSGSSANYWQFLPVVRR